MSTQNKQSSQSYLYNSIHLILPLQKVSLQHFLKGAAQDQRLGYFSCSKQEYRLHLLHLFTWQVLPMGRTHFYVFMCWSLLNHCLMMMPLEGSERSAAFREPTADASLSCNGRGRAAFIISVEWHLRCYLPRTREPPRHTLSGQETMDLLSSARDGNESAIFPSPSCAVLFILITGAA